MAKRAQISFPTSDGYVTFLKRKKKEKALGLYKEKKIKIPCELCGICEKKIQDARVSVCMKCALQAKMRIHISDIKHHILACIPLKNREYFKAHWNELEKRIRGYE